jgi:single-stranded-DNA-specific exonuclease
MMRSTSIVGLRALIEASDLANESIDSHKVGFILAPRLNACGRMGHAAAAVRMLTCAPPDEASHIAGELSRLNRQRQQLERSILQQACEMAEDRGFTSTERRAIVLAHPDWHPGVIGIVCARLVDRFGRPAILLQQDNDFCKGSARSVDGYSIYDALVATAEHLITFGGHAAAAGLTLETSKLDAFSTALIEHANAHISAEDLTPTISIDCDARLAELDIAAVKGLKSLSPFGRANRRPMLRVSDLRLTEAPKQIGSNGRHLSLQLRQEVDGRRTFIRGVWWNAGGHAADLAAGMSLDAAIEPKLNEWNGRVSVEGEVADIRICE